MPSLRLATVIAVACLCGTPLGAQPLAFEHATVIDPSSATPGREVTVVVDGGRITAMEAAPTLPPGARHIDARGRYLLPGLWDMHVHLAALGPIGTAPERFVGHGVLGVRDMGGFPDQLFPLRAALRAGTRTGPELVMAGPTLNGEPAAPFHRSVPTADQARAAVRELRAAGVDFIKIHRATTREGFDAIVDEAGRQGLKVAGHVPLVLSWDAASAAGMHSIEHIQTIFENLQPDPARMAAEFDGLVARLEGADGQALIAALARRGTYFDPTLVGYEVTIDRAAPPLAARRRAAFASMTRVAARIAAGGVPILTGTDVIGDEGEMLWRELERLAAIGLSPAQVLTAATTTSATAAGRPELGRLAVGAPASFVVLARNPLEDVRHVRTLSAVVLRGRLIEGEALAALRK